MSEITVLLFFGGCSLWPIVLYFFGANMKKKIMQFIAQGLIFLRPSLKETPKKALHLMTHKDIFLKKTDLF